MTNPETAFKGLVLVGLPLGHDDDLSLRGLAFLKKVSVLACEDTRTLKRLLAHHRVPCPRLIVYHDHNGEQARPQVMDVLRQGITVGLVSDRGMPLISDPGYKLVEACLDEDIPVTVLPGPSAVTTALCLSGLPPDRFFFQGFLPRKTSQQQTLLKDLQSLSVTLIFFEAPHRLLQTLGLLKEVLGDRRATVARELTKTFESVKRGLLSELIDHYQTIPAKGEIVVLVEGASKNGGYTLEQGISLLREALEKGHSLKDAVQLVAAATDLPKRELYHQALNLKT